MQSITIECHVMWQCDGHTEKFLAMYITYMYLYIEITLKRFIFLFLLGEEFIERKREQTMWGDNKPKPI